MTRTITSVAALALAVMLSPAVAQAQDGHLLLPQVVVPEPAQPGQAQAQSLGAPADEQDGTVMIEEIRKQIGDRYVFDMSWSDDDRNRLSLLMSGTYLNDYISQGSGVGFSNGRFVPSEEDAPAEVSEGTSIDGDLAGLALSPEGIRAMAMMSPEQIKAIALMAELSRNPNADLAALLASAGAESGNGARHGGKPDQAMEVGDGNNLALVGWYAGEQDGTVYIENDQYLGSRVGIEVGAVIGQFGHVTGIDKGPNGIVVAFESGDRIGSLDVPEFIGPGIPALGGELNEPASMDVAVETSSTMPFGEIIVTDPAPVADTGLVRPPRRPDPVKEAAAPVGKDTVEGS